MAVVNTESEKPARRRGRYPKEFRRDAAILVIEQHRSVVNRGRPIFHVVNSGPTYGIKNCDRIEIVSPPRHLSVLERDD
jgi:hypothetical protein